MKIIGYLGSPKVNGLSGKLLKSALEGAKSKGAEVKKVDLIKSHIEHCRGCTNCYHKNPELRIGKCSIKDEMASILEEYVEADGYFLVSPVYDLHVTALMKKFLERKIALTYREKSEHAKLMEARHPAEFKKKASLLVTGNCGDDLIEVMGEPCFEAMSSHFMIEQVWMVDKIYVGGVESFTKEIFEQRMELLYQAGVRLVEEIEQELEGD